MVYMRNHECEPQFIGHALQQIEQRNGVGAARYRNERFPRLAKQPSLLEMRQKARGERARRVHVS